MINSADELISVIKEKGQVTQMQYRGSPLDIHCYSAYFQKKFYFFFENNSRYIWDATYTFNLTNLAIERGDGSDAFTVRIGPGQKTIRALIPIDPLAKCSISYNYTFRLEN